MTKRRRTGNEKRGTNLNNWLLELLKDEMRRDKRSGSYIMRDALENRYQLFGAGKGDRDHPPSLGKPASTTEIVARAASKIPLARADLVLDGVRGVRDDGDRRVPAVRVHVLPAGQRKVRTTPVENETQKELSRAKIALSMVELDRQRALDDREHALADAMAARTAATAREQALVAALHRRPRLARGARSGRPYVQIPVVDSSGKPAWKNLPLPGYRFRHKRA